MLLVHSLVVVNLHAYSCDHQPATACDVESDVFLDFRICKGSTCRVAI